MPNPVPATKKDILTLTIARADIRRPAVRPPRFRPAQPPKSALAAPLPAPATNAVLKPAPNRVKKTATAPVSTPQNAAAGAQAVRPVKMEPVFLLV